MSTLLKERLPFFLNPKHNKGLKHLSFLFFGMFFLKIIELKADKSMK
jgi:hypothetical protein